METLLNNKYIKLKDNNHGKAKIMEKQNDNVNVIEKTFHVEGMTCGGCASGVQRSLTKLEGVKSAEVSLAGSLATVSYDPDAVTPEQMQQAVEKIGFKLDKS